MRSLLYVIVSFCLTILCWGVYLPTLHIGQQAMSTSGGLARLRPFVCVGLAYFLVGVIVPAALLRLRGERGSWSPTGVMWSLAGGALGALGALGIVLAFNFGGKPVYVAPLVFGGAPVVNAFLTIFLARKMREIGPVFLAGMVMVVLGAVTVLVSAPKKETPPRATASATPATISADSASAAPTRGALPNFVMQLLSIAMTIVCWGAYGVTLHRGQAAMENSRLRPFLCVGLAYFAIAVITPFLILQASPEASELNVSGTAWSLGAGAAGALGALGIIMAFNFGGKPVFVMPLVYGGAPVVATLVSTAAAGLWNDINAWFLAGLILVIAGAVMVLVFAPKSGPHAPAPPPKPQPIPESASTATDAAAP
jgi:hypothetical protein